MHRGVEAEELAERAHCNRVGDPGHPLLIVLKVAGATTMALPSRTLGLVRLHTRWRTGAGDGLAAARR